MDIRETQECFIKCNMPLTCFTNYNKNGSKLRRKLFKTSPDKM